MSDTQNASAVLVLADAASLRAHFSDHLRNLTDLLLTLGAIAHADAKAVGSARTVATLDDQMTAVRLGARALWPSDTQSEAEPLR